MDNGIGGEGDSAQLPSEVFTCYGLYWRPENIFWGEPGKSTLEKDRKGKMLGVPSTIGKKGRVNPEKWIDVSRQEGIYVLYRDFSIIYVGQARRKGASLIDRLREHKNANQSGRWNRFSWFGTAKNGEKIESESRTLSFAKEKLLDHLEAILLAAAEPPFNRQGGRFGKKIQQLDQVWDPRLGITDDEFKELMKNQVFEKWVRDLARKYSGEQQ